MTTVGQCLGVLIRREITADVSAIRSVHASAFRDRENPDAVPVEAELVDALRAGDAWLPELSLVAVDSGDVVGHVVCSRAWVGAAELLGLGPLGVRADRQGLGVGTALMHAVLGAADALGEVMVVLLGHPDYYPRFGFRLAKEYGITPPVAEWMPHFQARELTNYDQSVRGEFVYAAPFREL